MLFVAGPPDHRPICIGLAKNPPHRLAELQAGHPHPLQIFWRHEVVHPRATLDRVRAALTHQALTPGWFDITATAAEYVCRNAILETARSPHRVQPPSPHAGPLSAAIARATHTLGPWPSTRRNPEGSRLYRKTLAAYLLIIERRDAAEIAPALQTVPASINRWAQDPFVLTRLGDARNTAIHQPPATRNDAPARGYPHVPPQLRPQDRP